MQLNQLKLKNKRKKGRRVGRGGCKGKTCGRGTKGQKARAGHRIRPAERDFLIRIPKKRGYRNKSLEAKNIVINVGELEKLVSEKTITKQILAKILNIDPSVNIKILGGGEVKKAFEIEGITVSKSAKEKIEKAKGVIK
ncbi:MAG: uL15 family ribosomal protein [Candidatus Pacebacteria bacterium]|nr:uL15 family ribosomal protein [Candidatus Paceibacterota bacterium]